MIENNFKTFYWKVFYSIRYYLLYFRAQVVLKIVRYKIKCDKGKKGICVKLVFAVASKFRERKERDSVRVVQKYSFQASMRNSAENVTSKRLSTSVFSFSISQFDLDLDFDHPRYSYCYFCDFFMSYINVKQDSFIFHRVFNQTTRRISSVAPRTNIFYTRLSS